MGSKPMANQFHNVSQVHIARALGISQAAVSYALNHPDRVHPETRQRVERMCRQLNYTPNAHARTLRTARSRLVGVAMGTITDPYQAHLVHALESQLHEHGLQMLFHSVSGEPAEVWHRMREFIDHRVCGIIFQSHDPKLYAQFRRDYGGLFAAVSIGATMPGSYSVGCDYHKAAKRVAEHLIGLGRRKLATNVFRSEVEHDSAKIRSFTQATLAAGLPAPVQVSLQSAYYEHHLQVYGRVVAQAVLEKHPDVDGFFFSCDDIAVGAVSWMREAGIRVPEDIAVVGFNDTPAAMTSPIPLTTIRQPVTEYARAGVEWLVNQIDGEPSEPQSIAIDCPLIVRRSTDANWTVDAEQAPPPRVVFEDAPAAKSNR